MNSYQQRDAGGVPRAPTTAAPAAAEQVRVSSQDDGSRLMAVLRTWLLRKLLERHAQEYSERHGLPITKEAAWRPNQRS